MEDFIQLQSNNIKKIGIKDSSGNDTGEHLEFDLEDIEMPEKMDRCQSMHKKNLENLAKKFTLIEKQPDKEIKGSIMSFNEKEKMKALKEFYIKEMEALDLFLGPNGTKKILNGRNPYYTMFDDINKMLEPILPTLQLNADSIKNKIIAKYGKKDEESDILS